MKIFIIDGKKYIHKRISHYKGTDKFELIPFNEKEYDKVVDEIANTVKKAVNPVEAVKQALGNLEYEEVLAIRKKLRQKTKFKATQGCYEITIGKYSIPLVY